MRVWSRENRRENEVQPSLHICEFAIRSRVTSDTLSRIVFEKIPMVHVRDFRAAFQHRTHAHYRCCPGNISCTVFAFPAHPSHKGRTSGRARTMNTEHNNTSDYFIRSVQIYVYQNPLTLSRLSHEHIPREYGGMPIYVQASSL